MHQLGNELFIRVGILAFPSVTFGEAVSCALQRLSCPDLCLGPAYGTVQDERMPSQGLQCGATYGVGAVVGVV